MRESSEEPGGSLDVGRSKTSTRKFSVTLTFRSVESTEHCVRSFVKHSQRLPCFVDKHLEMLYDWPQAAQMLRAGGGVDPGALAPEWRVCAGQRCRIAVGKEGRCCPGCP